MIELAKSGRWLGGPTPTGYTSKRIELVDVYEEGECNVLEKKKKTASMLVPVEEEIQLVQQIGYKYLELKSLSKLQAYFLENNIYSKNNIEFSICTLRGILSNPIYAPNDADILEYFNNKGITIYAEGDRAKFDGKYGLSGYGKKKDGNKDTDMKDWIISVGRHKPAFKEGLVWIRIQKLLEKNKEKRYRAESKHNFLFSGILRCSECGSFMRPKISQGGRFYYTCELKEKSRGTKCNSRNIRGLSLDKLMIEKLEEIFVPTSEIYQELSKISIKKDRVDIEDKEEKLKKKLKVTMEAIKNLIDKLKYMDVEVVELINEELKKLKAEKKQIEDELEDMQKKDNPKTSFQSVDTASLILDIINNCLKSFDSLDIKSKKDLLRILIEEMKGSGKNVEVKILNTKIKQTDKRLFSDMFEETTYKKELNVVSRLGKQFL